MSKQFSIDPRRLRPNPWNTNIVSPDNEAKIAASYEELGEFKPLIVREKPDSITKTDYEILGGEHRWKNAIEKGAKEIAVFNVGVIDDEKAKKISIADNLRYGTDNTTELAKLLESLGSSDDLQRILPYGEADLTAIFSTADIALDDLDLLDDIGEAPTLSDEKPAKVAKTHTILRFKVPIEDAETIAAKIAKAQKDQGFTGSDELTNAGDALVHLLIGESDA